MNTRLQGIGQQTCSCLSGLLKAKWALAIAFSIISISNLFAQVGISTTSITPNSSSILELRSTTLGFLPPRMTTTERDAISSPATGLVIYNTTTNLLNFYNGSSWQISASGSVSSVSVTSANGFAGTVATATTTPAITISTTVTGMLKGNGTAISAATAGTDYSAGTSALATGILKSTTTTGALSIAVAADFPTLNQNTTGTAANVTGTVAIGNGGTGQITKAAAYNALTPITTLGDLVYGSAANTASRLAGNTTATKQFLTQTGNGTVSAAPAWGTISNTDVSGLGTLSTLNSVDLSGIQATGTLAAARFGALTGDVTNTAGSYATTIANNAVTLAKFQQIATNSLLGRSTAATGNAEVINVGSGLSLSGGTLSATGSGGTVTSVSVASANGLAGTVSNATTTPAITLSTSVTGILKGNGTAISAATSGTDYSAGTSALATGILKSTTTTGALSIATAGTDYQVPITTGDVTTSGATATIANSAVTLGKMANMATSSLIYRKTAGSGAPEVNTLATLKTDLGLTGTNSGDQTITLTGDVTGSGTGSFATTIANNVVSNTELSQMPANTIKGNNTASTANAADLTVAQLKAMLGMYTAVVGTDVSNTTTTAAKITDLDLTLGPGTYTFKYFIRYQAAATTTGVKFSVNHSGTVTAFVANVRWVDVSATASTAAPSQAEVLSTGAVMGAFSARAKSTAGWGTTLSVDVANSDMLMIIEGLVVVSVSGDLQLYHGSEIAAATTVKTGSSVIITKIN